MNFKEAIEEMIDMLSMGMNMGFYSDEECQILDDCFDIVEKEIYREKD